MKRLVSFVLIGLILAATAVAQTKSPSSSSSSSSSSYYWYPNTSGDADMLSPDEAAEQQFASYFLGSARLLSIAILLNNLRGFYRPGPTGGDLFTSMEVGANASWAKVKYDPQPTTGDDLGGSAYWTGTMADTWQFGIAANYDDLDLGDWPKIEQKTMGVDLWANYLASEQLTIGAFFDYTDTDFEYTPEVGPKTTNTGDDRYGMGLLASYAFAGPMGMDMAATGTLASMNKDSVDGLITSHETYAMLMIDARQQITEMVGMDLYGAYTTQIEASSGSARPQPDNDYFTVGLELDMAVTDALSVTLGYEVPLELKDYNEIRVNTGVSFRF